MTRLSNIRLSSLRGMPRDWGDIAVGERGAIVLGDNGTGKSSIVDAVEIVIAGESSLYAEARQGVNWQRGAPHVIDGAPAVSCTLVCDDGSSYEATLTDPIEEPIQEWIQCARLSKFVLRRHMLLRFIVAQPADRYQALAAFLDLSSYVAIEERLHGLEDSIRAEIASHDSAVRASEDKLRAGFDLTPGDAIDIGQLEERTNESAVALGIISEDDEIPVPELAKRAREAINNEKVSAELELLAGLKGSVAQLAIPSALMPHVESAEAASSTFEKIEHEEIQLHLVAVIEATLSLIGEFDVDTCPVCESEVDRNLLEENLRARLNESEELIQARNAADTMAELLRENLRSVIDSYGSLIEASGNLSDRDAWEAYKNTHAGLLELEKTLGGVPTVETLNSAAEALGGFVSSHTEILADIDALIGELGGTERWNALRTLSTQADLCSSEGPFLRSSQPEKAKLTGEVETAAKLAAHASEARKEVVAEILNDVTVKANEYYEAIHPGEGISTSQLHVRSATDASVNLTCEFAGNEENPLLHFSESHLDTLGLCYFLAIRRKQADSHPDFKLVVLDDVMHSVDSEHRRRVVDVLRDDFADHQLIVTTHDKVFFQYLRGIFRTPDIKQHRLTGWTLQRGPVLADPTTDIDRVTVADVRITKSAEELSAAAGRFMESLLKKLAERLQLNIIARFESRHTIGDIWQQLRSKLNRTQSFTAIHGDLADRINGTLWMRNEIGAHDNEEAVLPSDAEVQNFAELLTDLYQATFCQDCFDYIKRQENGDWSCQCGNLRYERD